MNLRTRLRGLVERLTTRIHASVFGVIVARTIGVAVAVVVLAWIGRSATAGPHALTEGAPAASSPPSSSAAEAPTSAPSSGAPGKETAAAAYGGALPAGGPPPAGTASSRPGEAEASGGPASETAAASASAPRNGSARATPADPVYLNAATETDLRRLPGVGAKRADAIVALRRKLGRFQRLEDLLRVKGIGRTALRKWRPLVRLDAPPGVEGDGGSVVPTARAAAP
jgi:competence protein ComEA